MYDLQSQLESFDLYDTETIDRFCLAFYEASQPDELLHGILDGVVEQWADPEIDGNEELRQVIEGDNTETNKRYKFDRVIDEILLDFVNSKLALYTKLSKPEINDYLKQHLYRAYLEQPSSHP